MTRRRVSFVLIMGLLVTVGSRPSLAATPEWTLRDYVHTVWTHRDGVPLTPQEFAQTADGYLWFTTQGQLIRFDGMRFMPVAIPCQKPAALEQGDSGSLWVLCHDPESKLIRRAPDGRTQSFSVPAMAGHLRDREGRLWIYGKGLGRFENGRYHEIAGQFGQGIRSATQAADGTIWVATSAGLINVSGEQIGTVPVSSVWGLAPSPAGGILACQVAIGIRQMIGEAEPVLTRPPPGGDFMCTGHSMAVDSSGGIWATTRQHGVALIQGGRVETSLAPGELSGFTTDVFIDREGSTWVGSTSGLHRFRKPMARLLSSIASVPPQPLLAFVDPRSEVWVGTGRRLVHLNLATGMHEMLDGHVFRALASDREGRVWIGMEQGLGFVRDGTIVPVLDAAGSSIPRVVQFGTDANGELWGLADRIGLYQITPGPPRRVADEPQAENDLVVSARHGTWITLTGGGVKQYLANREPIRHDTERGTEIGTVLTLADGGDTIWMGDRGGLVRWRDGRLTRWTRAHGLPGTGEVHEITTDRAGRLWLMTSGGIIALSRGHLDAMPDEAPGPLQFALISVLDRVVPHSGAPRLSPRISAAPDGRLYFTTVDSVAIVDPDAIVESTLRPTIALESALVDNEPVALVANTRFTAPSRVRFEYTALSLRSPESARFRYRLEGYDRDWIEAGTERHVTYGTLPPGIYRFRVIGSGSEGVWNEDGDAFAFQIVPVFYNTWWFRALVITLVATAIFGAHRLRVKRVAEQMRLLFKAQLDERARIAGDLHDTLLQSTSAASLLVQHADEVLKDDDSPGIHTARAALGRVSRILTQVGDEGRATVKNLRDSSATANNLTQLLSQAASAHAASGIDFRVIVNGAPRPLQPPVLEEVARIAGEAIANAFKHSGAKHITAEIAHTKSCFGCIVRDDGVGIEPQLARDGRDGHFGLAVMRERAQRIGGILDVRRTETGTEVDLSIPSGRAYGEQPHL